MEKILASGAKLEITTADFASANALRKALMKSLKGISLGPDILNQDMSVLAGIFADVGTSDEVESAIFLCGQKALYAGAKFDRSLFDDPKLGAPARRDFLEASWLIAKENVFPFFEQPLSLLKTLNATKRDDPK